jgi:hypothetical protein
MQLCGYKSLWFRQYIYFIDIPSWISKGDKSEKGYFIYILHFNLILNVYYTLYLAILFTRKGEQFPPNWYNCIISYSSTIIKIRWFAEMKLFHHYWFYYTLIGFHICHRIEMNTQDILYLIISITEPSGWTSTLRDSWGTSNGSLVDFWGKLKNRSLYFYDLIRSKMSRNCIFLFPKNRVTSMFIPKVPLWIYTVLSVVCRWPKMILSITEPMFPTG